MVHQIPRRLMLAAAAVATVAVLAACTGGGDTPAGGSTTITIGQQETAALNFDPALNDVNATVQLSPVYDTLIMQLSDGTLQPNVATDWEYTTPTEFVLTIRDDVTFSDGEELTADGVKANLEAVQSKGGPFSGSLAGVASVTATDDTTVTLELSAPNPSLPAVLSSIAGMLVAPDSIDDPSLSTTPVGSGPYTLTESLPGQSYSYEKRDDYWNADHYFYDKVDIQVIVDTQALLNALQTGQVDVIQYPADAQIQALVDSGSLDYESAAYNVQFLMLLDQAGTITPALGDVRVRQAINYALDREALAGLAGEGFNEPTDQVLKPGQSGYDADLEDVYPYDPDKAKDLLADAGYPDGFALPMVNISYFDQGAQAIGGYLAAVGITLDVTNVPIGEYQSSITSGQYPSAYFAYNAIDPYSDLGRLVLPTGDLNTFKIDDPDITSLMTEAGAAATADDLSAKLAEVNSIVVNNAWFAPFQFDKLGIAHSKDVTGISFDVNRPPYLYDWKPAA